MDDLKRITKYEKVENFISNLANETLLIYSPTSLKKTIIDDKININLIVHWYSTNYNILYIV